MPSVLSLSAQNIINDYFNLPFPDVSEARCPYFNNAKLGQRGQLKVLIGKGAPAEIVEEAKIISIQYRQNVFDKKDLSGIHFDHPASHEQTECVRQFLIDNNLGVDCSGFVTNVLRAHYKDVAGFDLAKKFFITPKKNFLRWLIARLRPVEQMSVAVYANNKNTEIVKEIGKIQPGDVVIMLKTGPNKNHNHILLITETDQNKLGYVHARAWSVEGKYGHGVSRGTISIINPEKWLVEQKWEENGKINDNNETFLEAAQAEVFEVRRVKI